MIDNSKVPFSETSTKSEGYKNKNVREVVEELEIF